LKLIAINARTSFTLQIKHTISEWSRIRGIPYSTLYSRIFKYKWDLEKAFKADRRNQ
jgi:hypothetical protein